MATVAEQFVRVLRQAGVERIYGVVGDSLNPVVDAVRRIDGIEWVHVRNEEAGAFAAAAEAELTGRLAVCAGSCGPGNTHLVQGLFDAQRSRVPVLALCLPHHQSTNRHRLLPGDAPRAAAKGVQRLLRAGQRRGAVAAHAADRDPECAGQTKRLGVGAPRRRRGHDRHKRDRRGQLRR